MTLFEFYTAESIFPGKIHMMEEKEFVYGKETFGDVCRPDRAERVEP